MGMATAIPVNVYKINKKEDKAMKQKFMELVVQQLNKVSYRDLVLAKQGHFDKIQYFEHDKKLNRKQTEYINDLIHEFENHEKNYDGVVYRIHGEYVENVRRRMEDRLNFVSKLEGNDKLPEEALEAIKRALNEIQ